MYECENCNKEFKSLNALTKHMIQHNKDCYDFYIDKYGCRDNFPWKRLSDNKNKNIIKCINCGKRCIGKNGISSHVLQHSKKCINKYNVLYGYNRTKWPEETGLRLFSCKDCGKVIDNRSKYCSECRQFNHNVMKIPKVILKNKESNRPRIESKEFKEHLSKMGKERYKNNPELAKKQKQYMLQGGAIKARANIKNPSNEQMKLFEIVNSVFPGSILEYPVQVRYNKGYNIDIAVVNHMIAFEHDLCPHNTEYDFIRQLDLENCGWLVIRFNYIPDENQLLKKLFNSIN